MDIFTSSRANKVIFHMWGGCTPISMGDGIKFRVMKSKLVDYVYIRYLSGYTTFEVEYGALVGTDYDVLDRVKPVMDIDLVRSVSAKLFYGQSLPSVEEGAVLCI